MHILNAGGRLQHVTAPVTSSMLSPPTPAVPLHWLPWHSLFYLIYFALSDYESGVSEVGNIHDILPYQFEPIRLSLSEL